VFDTQETQVLEAEQARLKDDIQCFRKEKNELEFILETHRTHCGPSTVGNRTVGNTAAVSQVSAAVTGSRSPSVNVTSVDTSLPTNSHFQDSGNFAAATENAAVANNSTTDVRQPTAALPSASTLVSHSVGVRCRPSSLPALPTARAVALATSTAGMNLLTMGLDSLADGHTGLTPLTGIPSGPIIVVGMPSLVTSSATTGDSSGVVRYL